jgi:hypothetical protein
MRDRSDALFMEYDLHGVLEAQRQKVALAVDQIPEKQFQSNSDDQVVAHLLSDLCVTPITLDESAMTMTQTESKMDVSQWRERNPFRDSGPIMVPSFSVTVAVPYEGDAVLWKCRPNQWSTTVPHGRPSQNRGAGTGVLTMTVELPADSKAEEFKRRIDETLSGVRSYLSSQKSQIEQFNAQLPNHVLQCVQKRRARLGKAADLLKVLNIPLATKPGAPDVSHLPIKRRLVVPLAAPAAAGEKSYQIDDAVYEHILRVIRHEGASMESARETFIKLGEEDLRQLIIAHLNGHYEGEAKAEAFRGAGKTDITIERENRAAFVAECKLWKGDKQLTAAIDQLLGYLTWRDGKTAIVLFNKDVAGFAEIQAKMPELVKGHPRFVSVLEAGNPSEWRFRFKSKDDDDRLVTVHVFLFNLFVTEDRR